MDESLYLDGFTRRLRRAGLPRDYVQSAAEELRDHLEDVREAHGPANADRLGDGRELAASYIAGYRSSSMIGRHPFASLFLGGAAVAGACQLLGMMAWFGLCSVSAQRAGARIVEQGGATAQSPPELIVGGWSTVQIVNVLAVALAVPVMLRVARYAGRGRAGVCLAMFWPSLFAPCTPITLMVPVGAPASSSFAFTYGLAWGEVLLPPLMAAIVPLWVGVLLARRWSSRSSSNRETSTSPTPKRCR
jgi:hypothetical protein